MRRIWKIAFAGVVLAGTLAACSPYRVHKKAPKHSSTKSINFLDFKRSSCGCN